MKNLAKAFLAPLLTLALSSGCAGEEVSSGQNDHKDSHTEPTSKQPYAGYEERAIKALDKQRIDDLLEGRGAGYALAAELNRYPGPRHVLDLAEDLGLTEEQEETVQAIFAEMEAEVRPMGRELVNLEERLDQSFREETIDEDQLARLIDEIALVEGDLRNAHLSAHLQTRDVLSQEQVEEYDRLRGYSEPGDSSRSEEHQH
jgi:hypothetical protein